MNDTAFDRVLRKYRAVSVSERDNGCRFERLMRSYLETDPVYADMFASIWFWNDFP
jgi:predicted helicase